MATYLLTYDLRKVRNYQPLYAQLAAWGAISPLESVWLLDHPSPAATIRDILARVMDDDDGLVIVQLVGTFDWATRKIPTVAVEWLKRRSP